MRCRISLVVVAAALAAAAAPSVAAAQVGTFVGTAQMSQEVRRSGPRFGMTFLGGDLVDTLAARGIDVGPMITQFGWHVEREFGRSEGGPTAVSQWLFLVGGLDQNTVLPSVTWLVGVRGDGDFEFGVGPNITPASVALAFGGGVSLRSGKMRIPMNIGIVPGRFGWRTTFITGFNTH